MDPISRSNNAFFMASQAFDNSNYDSSGNDQFLTSSTLLSQARRMAIVFDDARIKAFSLFSSASLSLTNEYSVSAPSPCTFRFYGAFRTDAAAEHTPFSSLPPNDPNSRFASKTVAYVDWRPVAASANTRTTLSGFGPILEELSRQPGYVNDLTTMLIVEPIAPFCASTFQMNVASTSTGGNKPSLSWTALNRPLIWEHLGSGTLTFARSYIFTQNVQTSPALTRRAAVADFDNDGMLDVLFSMTASPFLLLLANTASGTPGQFAFATTSWISALDTNGRTCSVADMDYDGDMDIVVHAKILRNNLPAPANSYSLSIRPRRNVAGVLVDDYGASVRLFSCDDSKASYTHYSRVQVTTASSWSAVHFGLGVSGYGLRWKAVVSFTDGVVVTHAIDPQAYGAARPPIEIVNSSPNDLSACAVCGDGIVFSPEQCDDGNLISGDGCSSTCTIELGFACTGAPSVCSLANNFCPPLFVPPNASVNATARRLGDVALIVCSPGYAPAGVTMRACTSSGLWSGSASASCTAQACASSLVPPANGAVSSTTGVTDSTSTFTCNFGYGPLQGSASRTCLSNGLWSGSADQVCPATPCTNPSVLSAPANGDVSPASGGTGTLAVFSCNAGYTLANTATRSCQASGVWTGASDTVCNANACSPTLTVPSNGASTCLTGTTGTTCTQSCNAGYTNVGGSARLCQTNGLWSGSPALCNANACSPALIPPNFGTVSSTTGVTGQTSNFACNAGYTLSGWSSRTCSITGAWTNLADQVCVPNPCPSLTAPINGAVSPSTGSTGTLASYSCNAGHTLVGSLSTTCQTTGTWSSATPTCSPNPCPPLFVPANGQAVPSNTGVVGEVRTLVCNSGYTLALTTSRTCSTSATWTGLADTTCTLTPNFCPLQLAPTDGVLNTLVRTLGGTAAFTCNAGFTLSGTASRVCQTDATWSGSLPLCSSCGGNCVLCPSGPCTQCAGGWNLATSCTTLLNPFCQSLSTPANGLTANAPCARTLNATCGPTSCNAGFFLSAGLVSRVCQATASWSGVADVACSPCTAPCLTCAGTASACQTCMSGFTGPPSCATRVPCTPDLVAPTNGAVSTSTGVFDTNATFSCNTGFARSGSAWRYCQASGLWTGAPDTLCSPLPCLATLSAPTNGAVSPTSGVFGTQATYLCNAGYSLAGSATRTCQADQSWSLSAPVCNALPCPNLVTPANGFVAPSVGVTGTVATYSCGAGYSLVPAGGASRTCSTSSSWTGIEPACQANPCSAVLVAPAFGNVSRTTGVTGDVASFSCQPGYNIGGTTTRLCQTNGVWSGLSDTTCNPISCPVLIQPVPVNGLKSCTGLTLGSTCSFSCNFGFALFGTAVRTCSIGSVWSGLDDALCSSTVANLTTVHLANPASFVVGTDASFNVTLRSASGPTSMGGDIVSLALSPLGGGSIVNITMSFYGAGLSRVAFRVPTQASSQLVYIRVNGLPVSPVPWLIYFAPGPTIAARSTALGPGLELGELFTLNEFTVTARDSYGNARQSGGDVVAASLKSGSTVVTLSLVGSGIVDRADGTYGVQYTPPVSGLYVVSVTLAGQAIDLSPWLVEVSSKCGYGQFAITPTGPCALCAAGTYSDELNVPSCTACPPGATTAISGAASLANCTCAVDHYNAISPVGQPCLACPVGASCAGGSSLPVAAPGFSPSRDPGIFLQCSTQTKACLGDGRCARGYDGRLCANCAPKFYRSSGGLCEPCNSWKSGFVATLFILAVFVACALLVRLNTTSTRFYGLAAFMIGFTTVQISAVYASIDVSWPPWAKTILDGLSFANLDISLTSPECALTIGSPFVFKYVTSVLIPLLILIPFAFALGVSVLYIALVRRRAASKGASDMDVVSRPQEGYCSRRLRRLLTESVVGYSGMVQATGRAYAQSLVFCYMPLLQATLLFFDCTQSEDGVWVVSAMPMQVCYSGTWNKMLPVAVVFALLYCVGIPAFITWLLRTRRRAMLDVQFTLTYAFLVARFRPRFYLFEPLGIMLRKLGVVFMATVLRSGEDQAAMVGMVLLGCLVQVAMTSPYGQTWHNVMENACLASGVVILFSSLLAARLLRTVLLVCGFAVLFISVFVGILYEIFVVARADRQSAALAERTFFTSGVNGVVVAADAESRGMFSEHVSDMMIDDRPSSVQMVSLGESSEPVYGSHSERYGTDGVPNVPPRKPSKPTRPPPAEMEVLARMSGFVHEPPPLPSGAHM